MAKRQAVGHGRDEIRAYLVKSHEYYSRLIATAVDQRPAAEGPALEDWRRVQALRDLELAKICAELERMDARDLQGSLQQSS